MTGQLNRFLNTNMELLSHQTYGAWALHINTVCTRTKKSQVCSIDNSPSTPAVRPSLKLYKTLVQPHLEYAAQVWDPYMTKDIAKLENVQKLALKVCLIG